MYKLFCCFGLAKVYPLFEILCELFSFIWAILSGIYGLLKRILKPLFEEKKPEPFYFNGERIDPPSDDIK